MTNMNNMTIKTSALFTVAGIKVDKLGRLYMTMYSKDGNKLYKLDGSAVMEALSKTVFAADGDGIHQGDLIAIEYGGIKDSSFGPANNRVNQTTILDYQGCTIKCRKGSGVMMTAPDGSKVQAHAAAGLQMKAQH